MREDIIERLEAMPALAEVPRSQLEWLVERGEVLRFDDGYRWEGAFPGLVLLISGRFSVRMTQNGVEREMREITPGRVSGFLPFSKMVAPRGYLVADGPVELVFLSTDDFREMARECFEFTGVCVQEMLARVRVFKGDDKHQEKMAALGRLSAGLAHELNNPASAVVRGARELAESLDRIAGAAMALGALGFQADSTPLRSWEAATRRTKEPLSTVQRALLEDDLAEWVSSHGVDGSLAACLAESGLSVADLDEMGGSVDPKALPVLLGYVAADVTARALAADVLSAATRIDLLVSAVKKHTHMDRPPVMEPIHLSEHISDAVTLLGSKATLNGTTLSLSAEADLPAVTGTIADLNQVWVHLIDNAIDATAGGGRVDIDVKGGGDAVVVTVTDDGPGIPEEDRARVFEPFFTTKDVRQGRGLGLDIVRTVVTNHGGTVDFESRAGCTAFRVTLPTASD